MVEPDPGQQAHFDFLKNQAQYLWSTTRTLKNAIWGAASNQEIPPDLAKWMMKELLEMAQMLEVPDA